MAKCFLNSIDVILSIHGLSEALDETVVIMSQLKAAGRELRVLIWWIALVYQMALALVCSMAMIYNTLVT